MLYNTRDPCTTPYFVKTSSLKIYLYVSTANLQEIKYYERFVFNINDCCGAYIASFNYSNYSS